MGSAPLRRLTSLGSVRTRVTLVAAFVVAVALAAGSVVLLLTLRYSLERGGDDAARTRANDLVALAASDALPPVLTAPGEDDIVQVVDDSGTVVAATADHLGDPPIADFAPSGEEPEVRTVTGVPDGNETDDYRVWAMRAPTAQGPLTVYIGTSLESVFEATAALRTGLLVGVPPLLALLAFVIWVMLGRALRPVESIRAEVADISERALDRRVPVPPTHDEIGSLARTMNSMLDRLQDASERQRAFVGDASHELQSPIASLRAQLEVALAHPETAAWPAVAVDLLAESRQMERLVRDLLVLARTDDHRHPRPTRPLDLDDIVLDEAARLRTATRIRLDTSGVSAAPMRGSHGELTRLVRNLLENAERHAASSVRVELSSEDGTVRLVVHDDGPGVPPELRRHVFDRFTRGDGARHRAGGGTGLGLAIVRGVAERQGGTVTLDEALSGARFVAVLPQEPPGEERAALPRHQEGAAP